MSEPSTDLTKTQESPPPPVSVLRKRLQKFRTLKRGYYSFLILTLAYTLSFFLPLIMNSKALLVSYQGQYYVPAFTFYQGKVFDQFNEFTTYGETEANYRLLKARLAAQGKGDYVVMPLIPYAPDESARIFAEEKLSKLYAAGDFSVDEPDSGDEGDDEDDGYAGDDDDEGYAGDDDDDEGYSGDEDEEEALYSADDDEALAAQLERESPPYPPSFTYMHLFGTDNRGRDLLCRLAYGFNVSMTFALFLLVVAYSVGISLGSVLGFYGGRVDLIGQRFIEVWQTVPFLFTVMIISDALREQLVYRPGLSSIMQPSFIALVLIMAVFSWMGMTYYVRGEFLREKAKDYVSAAISIGTTDRVIIFKHILPNALTPVVTFSPFAIVGFVSSLVALDYLGFGLPPPTPSWGELMKQALPEHIKDWWMVASPIGALFTTLLLVVFVGEAVREAFDPKVFSRLR